MQTERFGIIDFFGIFIPGSYLGGMMLLGVVGLLDLTGIPDSHIFIFDKIKENQTFFAAVFVFVSYLLGVVLRLYAPESIDKLSTAYLKLLRVKKEWVTDSFPYSSTLIPVFEKSGTSAITDFLFSINPKFGTKPYFNYCKLLIVAKNPALAAQVHQAEALVRFLSGTTWGLIVGIIIALMGFITFSIKGLKFLTIFYGSVFIMSFIILLLILRRFKYQRRREVEIVWRCTYLVLTDGNNSKLSK